MNITIAGTGYVGLTTAAVLANVGYKVYTIDIDPQKIETIKGGKSYFFESGLDQFVKNGIANGNLIPTLEYNQAIKDSEIVFSCVGTPDNPDGSPNMTYIYQVAEEVAKQCRIHGKEEIIFVQKSTVPVGTGEELKKFINQKNPGLKVSYISNPEFLREGSALFDTLNVDRLAVGFDNEDAADILIKIFEKVDRFARELDNSDYDDYAATYHDKINGLKQIPFEDKVKKMDIKSAELVKVTANAFLALKISFANSIAKLSDKAGADINRVMEGVGADPRIGRSFLYAGLGWGGGCFPKDVSGLISVAEEYGVKMPILDAAVDENTSMVDFVKGKIDSVLKGNGRVGFLGLSFKPGTSDIRKSQSIKLANKLAESGYEVVAFDPQAMEEAKEDLDSKVTLVSSIEDAVDSADIVVIATEWKEFINYDWAKGKALMKGDTIIDGRNALSKEEMEGKGLRYIGVGV